MKTNKINPLRLSLVLLASAVCGVAQTGGYYNSPPLQNGVSAGAMRPGPSAEAVRPGSLNYVEGQVSSGGQQLTPQAVGHFALQPGQALTTGTGYAEVLLTPGAFLRLGPNSELSMASVGLSDTQIKLTGGNALVEVDQLINGTHLEVTIGTISADMLKRGLYQFSASPADFKVFDGQLDVIGHTHNHKIGKGDQILVGTGENLKKTGFNTQQAKTDPIYVWSQARSRDEAQQNQLAAANSYGYMPVGGGWFWDPYLNYYGFWPADGFLYSPFGFGFYGGFYPGFYGGYYGIHRHGFIGGGFAGRGFVGHGFAGGHGFSGMHGNGVGGGGRR